MTVAPDGAAGSWITWTALLQTADAEQVDPISRRGRAS